MRSVLAIRGASARFSPLMAARLPRSWFGFLVTGVLVLSGCAAPALTLEEECELAYGDLAVEDLAAAQEDLYRSLIAVIDEEIARRWEDGDYERAEFESVVAQIFPTTLWHQPRDRPLSDFRLVEDSEEEVEYVILAFDEYPELYARFDEWRWVLDRMCAHPDYPAFEERSWQLPGRGD